jgi:hypothetical protein
MGMDLSKLSDDTLLGKVDALAETERFTLVDLLIHLGELDTRDACQRKGYSSVFTYLTKHLGYAECDAMRRVRAARAGRKFPSILTMLARGELHLVGIAMLQPYLTSENYRSLLDRASRRSQREIEQMVAELSPAALEPKDSIRALPAPEPRNVFKFAADPKVSELFLQARDLLRHKYPAGRMEEVIGEALRRLIEQELPKSVKKTPSDPASRHIPAWVQAEVWERDEGRCAYVSDDGTRRSETGWLEYDHAHPWALGGRSDDPDNIRLLCRAHNQAEARRHFSPRSPRT